MRTIRLVIDVEYDPALMHRQKYEGLEWFQDVVILGEVVGARLFNEPYINRVVKIVDEQVGGAAYSPPFTPLCDVHGKRLCTDADREAWAHRPLCHVLLDCDCEICSRICWDDTCRMITEKREDAIET